MSYYAKNEESLLQNRSPAVVILMQSFGNKQKILHECSCQLDLLNELRKRDKMRGLLSIISLFPSEFNKFNNSRARMLHSIYHNNFDIKITSKYHFLPKT